MEASEWALIITSICLGISSIVNSIFAGLLSLRSPKNIQAVVETLAEKATRIAAEAEETP